MGTGQNPFRTKPPSGKKNPPAKTPLLQKSPYGQNPSQTKGPSGQKKTSCQPPPLLDQ